jgi:hypothetical protein
MQVCQQSGLSGNISRCCAQRKDQQAWAEGRTSINLLHSLLLLLLLLLETQKPQRFHSSSSYINKINNSPASAALQTNQFAAGRRRIPRSLTISPQTELKREK